MDGTSTEKNLAEDYAALLDKFSLGVSGSPVRRSLPARGLFRRPAGSKCPP